MNHIQQDPEHANSAEALPSQPSTEPSPAANGNEAQVSQQQPSEAEQPRPKPFSWLDSHPEMVTVGLGSKDATQFNVHRDLLTSRSEYFRNVFEERERKGNKSQPLFNMPDTSVEVFGLLQKYLYTDQVAADAGLPPSFESLIELWKLSYVLKIEGLGEKALEAMKERRRISQQIPSTPLLILVWRDCPQGCNIRELLLTWAAEYMRSSDSKAEFAQSLPKSVLAELVVTMSTFDDSPLQDVYPPTDMPAPPPRKNVHYLDSLSDEEALNSLKRSRRSGTEPSALAQWANAKGFWTRLVGPFKEPVMPAEDGVPDYFDKVKRPMDLTTIKIKMDRREYANEEEFVTDMRQIFENCFAYWKRDTPMYQAGEKLQKTFEEKYRGMNKWISKMGGEEGT
ncbi:TFIID associated protein [Emericellopsis cladophorae]|uniref:TFIID associated protein n=1 Tax=Emericellopsis cladophorae TaxID=2686198 RepID=A0A9Q0BHA0_9HYPO|nr:TFIID associated protein [Emericellopsis cladophorae]KAI6785317.1 TFIID associated protein [Emericellopsis cladophorae]